MSTNDPDELVRVTTRDGVETTVSRGWAEATAGLKIVEAPKTEANPTDGDPDELVRVTTDDGTEMSVSRGWAQVSGLKVLEGEPATKGSGQVRPALRASGRRQGKPKTTVAAAAKKRAPRKTAAKKTATTATNPAGESGTATPKEN